MGGLLKYEEPDMEIAALSDEDVIRTSGPQTLEDGGTGGNGEGDRGTWGGFF